MFRCAACRLGKTFVNSCATSNGEFIKYKECKYMFRFLSTESVSMLNTISNDPQNVVKSDPRITSFLDIANKVGLSSKNLSDVNNSVIVNLNNDLFLSNSKTLIEFGFSKEVITDFLKIYPQIFYINNNELSRYLELWRQPNFGEKTLLEILSKHPQLIESMGINVLERIRDLAPYFNDKERLVGTLLVSSPGVIYENWSSLKSKLDYLHSHNIPCKRVAGCNALDLSLFEMKTRIEFLERAGVYKKQVDLWKKDLKQKNPSIRNILCTSDELFAKTIAGLSLVEFEAFADLYKLESEELFEVEDIDDDDYISD